MRTCHRALLLAVAMVLLSTGICTAQAPAPAPRPRPGGLDEFPPEDSCTKTLYSGGCDAKACHGKCLSQLKGDGLCSRNGCQCSYLCKPPPLGI